MELRSTSPGWSRHVEAGSGLVLAISSREQLSSEEMEAATSTVAATSSSSATPTAGNAVIPFLSFSSGHLVIAPEPRFDPIQSSRPLGWARECMPNQEDEPSLALVATKPWDHSCSAAVWL
ncbi:hypothetical protein CRG98_047717 [Punica granatum]|uniref:Uncharacterized protein n=1 Tax=Punica granatum TaxID=22663 RepID=A0A2I0HJK8_PUNGR|nr:hypothetical protein CRG98_047717 [Punica granatum]